MFVLTETYKATQNNENPYMAIVLGIAIIVILAFGMWSIIYSWRNK